MTVPSLNMGEDGGVRNERAVKDSGTNKQVICKATEDMKEMNSTTRDLSHKNNVKTVSFTSATK